MHNLIETPTPEIPLPEPRQPGPSPADLRFREVMTRERLAHPSGRTMLDRYFHPPTAETEAATAPPAGKPRRKKPVPVWVFDGGLEIQAFTKGEARAKLKAFTGQPLKPGLKCRRKAEPQEDAKP